MFTNRYPRTQRKSDDRPSRSRRMAVSCSWPFRCGPTCETCQRIVRSLSTVLRSYCTISGRIGAVKTAGSGWVSPLAAPSAPLMETVGRLVILALVMRGCRWSLEVEIVRFWNLLALAQQMWEGRNPRLCGKCGGELKCDLMSLVLASEEDRNLPPAQSGAHLGLPLLAGELGDPG